MYKLLFLLSFSTLLQAQKVIKKDSIEPVSYTHLTLPTKP
jgi:hypothetical protein